MHLDFKDVCSSYLIRNRRCKYNNINIGICQNTFTYKGILTYSNIWKYNNINVEICQNTFTGKGILTYSSIWKYNNFNVGICQNTFTGKGILTYSNINVVVLPSSIAKNVLMMPCGRYVILITP